MAINANQFNPEDNDPNSQDQQGQDNFMSQPKSISGSEAMDSDAGPAKAGPKPTNSGRFQNLNAYLKANKNFNKEGGGLAGKVNQNLTSRSNALQQNFAQSKQDYQTTLDNARQRYDQQFVDKTLANPEQADASKFANMRDATYKGPTQLDPNLQVQAENFSNLAGNTGTEQGRFNLLKNIYNKPTYTSGQQTLDNLFLQSNPQQLANLQQSRVTANQLNTNLSQAQAQAAAQATDATNEANSTREATRNALTGAITGFDTNMNSAVQKALADRQKTFEGKQSDLYNAKLGSDEALKFGLLNQLGDTESNPIYNLDLSKYLQQSNVAPTSQSVASSDDYNRIAALGKLAGPVANESTSKIFDSYNNPAQAGSFAKESPYDFNKEAFQYDRSQAEANYRNAYNPEKAKYDQLYTKLYGGDSLINEQGNTAGSGGLQKEVTTKAAESRQKMQKEYDDQVHRAKQGTGATVTAINPEGLSDLDVLQKYQERVLNNSVGPAQYDNPYASLVHNFNTTKQKQYNSQTALDQLMNAMGANRKVNITDADQYKPVEVAPTVPRQLSTLNNIYNRT